MSAGSPKEDLEQGKHIEAADAVHSPPSTEKPQDYEKYHTQWASKDRAPEARGRDSHNLAKDYWLSHRFLGSMAAIGLGFCGGTGGYALIAPVLTEINDELGPSDNITWVGIAYVLCEAVVFLIVGRLSDLFGRRWFVCAFRV